MSCGTCAGLVYRGGAFTPPKGGAFTPPKGGAFTSPKGGTRRMKSCKYKPTRKNRNTLKRYKRGESIGFTLTSSLKAKGMIPRTSKTQKGKRIVSEKYCS